MKRKMYMSNSHCEKFSFKSNVIMLFLYNQVLYTIKNFKVDLKTTD